MFLSFSVALPLDLADLTRQHWIIAGLTTAGVLASTFIVGGLRGGISVVMALSLPHGPARQIIIVMTSVIVVFSILVQGLTLERVARRVIRS